MKKIVNTREINVIIFVCLMVMTAVFYSNCGSKNNTDQNQNPNSTTINNNEPESTPSSSTYNPNFKLAILNPVSGSYGKTCFKVIDQDLGSPGSGSEVKLTKSGIISWGESSVDLMKVKSDRFLLIRSYGENDGSVFSVDVDNENGRSHVVRIASQLAAGTNDYLTSPSITIELNKPSIGNLCADLYKHPFASTNVRNIVDKFIHFETTEKTCLKTGTLNFFKGKIEFNPQKITIAGYTLNANAALASDGVGSNGSSFGYTATDLEGNVIQFEINANGEFSFANWQLPDGSIIGCK